MIDIKQFVDPDRFYERLESAITEIRALAPVDGFQSVCLPGELEWERAQKWASEGLPIHCEHAAKLEELASAANLDVPWK